MKSIARDGISYNGISEYIPSQISLFSQKSIDKIITLEKELPEIDDILKVNIAVEIIDSKIVKTGKGTSLEGQTLTGYKLLSEGKFIVRVDYSSESNNGCIYTFKEVIYFDNATTISEEKGYGSRLIEDVYIEDIYVEKINERNLLANISFIFAVDDY